MYNILHPKTLINLLTGEDITLANYWLTGIFVWIVSSADSRYVAVICTRAATINIDPETVTRKSLPTDYVYLVGYWCQKSRLENL